MYPTLRQTYTEFLRGKVQSIRAEQVHGEAFRDWLFIAPGTKSSPYRALYESLGLTEEEFGEKYIKPWDDLSSDQIREVVKYWNLALSHRKSHLLEATPIDEYRALQWTLVNVVEANLFKVFLPNYEAELAKEREENQDLITLMYIAPEYSLPYKQCRFCGRLDTDPRGHTFSLKRLTFCHQAGCPTDSNPSQHHIKCCYGNWKRIKNNIRNQLARHNPRKLSDVFMQFCEKRYTENLKIQDLVHVQKEKKPEWKLIYEQQALTS